MGLSEVRRLGDNMVDTKNGNLLCTCGEGGQRGVGFLISRNMKSNLIAFKGNSDRIALATFRIGNQSNTLTIIQVYAPTTAATEEEIDKFYGELTECISSLQTGLKHFMLIIGDFNSKIGKRKTGEERLVGRYGYGERNENGSKLLDFCHKHQLKVVNTWFKKKNYQKWTWQSPNHEHKNQIDYILAPTTFHQVKNFEVIKKFKFISDHRPILCELDFQHGKIKKRGDFHRVKPELLEPQFRQKLDGIFTDKDSIDSLDVDSLNSLIVEGILEAASQSQTYTYKEKSNPKENDQRWAELKKLIKDRDRLRFKKNKTNRDKIELNVLCKLAKKKIREKNREKEQKVIEEILDTTKSTKQIRKRISLGHYRIPYMLDEKGIKEHSRNGISRIATSFYQKIYERQQNSTPSLPMDTEVVEPEPTFLVDEIVNVLKNLKKNKAGGEDRLINEHFIYAKDTNLIKYLHALFNKVLATQKIPEGWKISDIILIHKKGDKHKIDNYRPISLGSALSKIFSKLIENRIKPILNSQQPVEQAGFRSGFSTTDHLFTLNLLIEKSIEYNFELHLAFIDFKKAFDSIDHSFMLTALKNQGVPIIYIKIIEAMYTNLKARILTDVVGQSFNINRGVKQGDPPSPILFAAILEEIFKKLQWSNKGIMIDGIILNNLRFADDIVLIAKSSEELCTMITSLQNKSLEAGLAINISKTKYMSKSSIPDPKIGQLGIEHVNEIKYLGQIVTFENKSETEINSRISLGWKKFWSLKYILKGKFSIRNKREILNSCVFPAITYGSQTWTLTKRLENKLKTTQNSMARSLLNITLRDKVTNSKIQRKLGGRVELLASVKRLKWEWAGHISRVRDGRWGNRMLNWYPRDAKRRPGRQNARWDDEIIKFIKNKHYVRVAQDRAEWARLKETFAQSLGFA